MRAAQALVTERASAAQSSAPGFAAVEDTSAAMQIRVSIGQSDSSRSRKVLRYGQGLAPPSRGWGGVWLESAYEPVAQAFCPLVK